MPKNIHIVSIGTSILGNYRNAQQKQGRELPPLHEDEKYERFRSDSLERQKINGFVAANPQKASAELNSMWDYLERGEVNEVYFVRTETNTAWICHRALTDYLRNRDIAACAPKDISGYYSIDDRKSGKPYERFIEGLSTLRDSVIRYIRNRKRESDCNLFINATGGYKPEVVILSLVGAMMHVPVYYRHEFFQTSVILPPIVFFAQNKAELEMLKDLAALPNARATRANAPDFYRTHQSVMNQAADFGLITVRRDDVSTITEIKLTPYGKFVEDTYRVISQG